MMNDHSVLFQRWGDINLVSWPNFNSLYSSSLNLPFLPLAWAIGHYILFAFQPLKSKHYCCLIAISGGLNSYTLYHIISAGYMWGCTNSLIAFISCNVQRKCIKPTKCWSWFPSIFFIHSTNNYKVPTSSSSGKIQRWMRHGPNLGVCQPVETSM